MTAVLLTRATVGNLNEGCKNNERLGVILQSRGTYFTITVRESQDRNQLKCGGPEYTMRPISGSAEVSGVSCIHEDLCVVIYASFLEEDTTKAFISKAFSLVDSCLSEFLREKTDIRILCILETDQRLANLFDDHKEKKYKSQRQKQSQSERGVWKRCLNMSEKGYIYF